MARCGALEVAAVVGVEACARGGILRMGKMEWTQQILEPEDSKFLPGAIGITAKMEKARPAEAWEGRQLGPAGHRSHQLADGRVGAGRPVRSFWWQRSGSTRGQQVLCPLPLPCLCPLSQ